MTDALAHSAAREVVIFIIYNKHASVFYKY